MNRLVAAAKRHCLNMVESGVFDHSDKDGTPSDRISATRFDWSNNAENIYMDSINQPGSVAQAENAYMSSTGHRDNILNNAYDRVGFAVCSSATSNFWVSDFGKEMTSTGTIDLVTGNTAAPHAAPPTDLSGPSTKQSQPNYQSLEHSASPLAPSSNLQVMVPSATSYKSQKCHKLTRRSKDASIKI